MSQSGRRKTSQLWNFFTIVDSECATCDVCQHKLSYRTSISNLKKHLRKKHHTLLEKSDGTYPMAIKKKLCPVEDGEIEYDPISNDIKSGTDNEPVPVIVEFVQAQETVTTRVNSSQPQESRCSTCSKNPRKQTISELYERIATSACSEEKSQSAAKEKLVCDVQEKNLVDSLQMERELKRKILETELEMKKEELNFKKNMYRIQLDHETKVNSLKLKMMERDLNCL